MSKQLKKKQKKDKKTSRLSSLEKEFQKAYDFHLEGDTDKAKYLYRQILQKDPSHSDALHLLGVIALENQDYDQALALIKRAIVHYPKAAPYYNNLAMVYRKQGLIEDAVASYRKALEINPDYAEAYNNLGTLLKDKVDLTGAVDSFESAVRLNTGFSVAYYNLGTVLCDQGHIKAAIEAYQKCLKINADFVQAHSNLLYTLHFSDQLSAQDVFLRHRTWGGSVQNTTLVDSSFATKDRQADRRLRIGYVSPDFCVHSVAFFIEDVLAGHNRDKVEIFCYSNTEKIDDFTYRFKELSDHWRDIRDLSDHDAAEMIRNDDIDILVDLAGHTRNNRLLIFAMKPAPVQVTWLGYPDTTGLEAMDYRLTDAIADPEGEADLLHTEKLYRMPHGFLCYRASGEFYPVGPSPFASKGAVTFGSFNNNSKISPRVIEAWAAILKRVPGSRLKLKARSFTDFGSRKLLLESFESHGIPSERIWFEGYRVSLKEHFLLYGTVDIALDTFPYNGTTTTCEALWMGVPVIALDGDRHVSRVSKSILTHMGLELLVAGSIEEYVDKAVRLANDPELMATLRSELRECVIDSPLLDSNGFTDNLESAYRNMWQAWLGQHGKIGCIEDNGVYQKNLEALTMYHPYLVQIFDQNKNHEIQFRISSVDSQQILVLDKQGRWVPLYKKDDIEADLAAIKSGIGHVKGKTICVMGASLQMHAASIIDMLGDSNLIVFVEAFPEIFLASLMIQDLKTVLAHPHVRLAIGDYADPYMIMNSENESLFVNHLGEFVEYHRGISIADEWYEITRDRFQKFLNRKKISIDTVGASGKNFLENGIRNLFSMAESRPLSELKNCLEGIPVIIVASGPSLSNNIKMLKDADSKALIVAADSAVAPLLMENITPHMVVSIDNKEMTAEKLLPLAEQLHDVDLLFVPGVTPKITNSIHFRSKYYAFQDTSSFDLFSRILGTNSELHDDIHSTIHLSLAAAQTMGCNPIIFTGLDLAFSGKQDHVNGTILNWGNTGPNASVVSMVESIHGEMIPSTHGFVSMIEICQRMIRSVPERTYIDASEGGAKIAGTVIQDLAPTLEAMERKTIKWPCFSEDTDKTASFTLLQTELNQLGMDVEEALKQVEDYEIAKERFDQFLKHQSSGVALDTLPVEIMDCLRVMDRINLSLEGALIVSYIKNIMVEFYEAYKELELDVLDRGQSEEQRLIASINQQSFVQEIRKTCLTFLGEQIEGASSLVDLLCLLEQTPEFTELIYEKIEKMMGYGYLNILENILEEMPPGSENDYIKGCLEVKKGHIKEGRSLLKKAAQSNPTLKIRVDRFLLSEVSGLLSQTGPDALVSMVIKRALQFCDEDSVEIVQICSERIKQFAILKIIENNHALALSFLKDSFECPYMKSSENLALCAYIMVSQGDPEFSGYLKASTELDLTGDGRKIIIQTLFFSYSAFDRDSFISRVITLLDSIDPKEPWVLKQYQEMWLICFWEFETDWFFMKFDEKQMLKVVGSLEKLSCVSELIPEWHFTSAMNEISAGNYEKARTHMERAVQIDLDTYTSHYGCETLLYMLSWINFFMQNNEEGLKTIERAASVSRRFDLHLMHAFFMFRSGHDNEAVNALNEKDLWECEKDTWMERVLILHHQGEISERISRVLYLEPFASWFSFVAWAMIDIGAYDLAKTHLEAAINNDPQAAFVWEVWGDHRKESGDNDGALEAYEKCMMILPRRLDTLLKIGELYMVQGNLQSALLCFRELVSKDPENKAVLDRLESIQQQLENPE